MYVPPLHNQPIFPSNNLPGNNTLPPRRKAPTPRSKRLIQYPPVLNLRQIQQPIWLNFYIVLLNWRKQDLRLLGCEGYAAQAVVRARPVDGGDALDGGRLVVEAVG